MNANIDAFISGVYIYPMKDYIINANIDDFISGVYICPTFPFANFRFSWTLSPPLVVCRFPLRLYIEPSTGCLQISASAIHWTFHLLFAYFHFSLILNLPLVVCLRPSGSALRAPPFGLRPSGFALRAPPAAPSALRACGASWIKGVPPIASWFCFIQTLKPPLVNGRFPLQLNIELSTGRLQISASTEHSYPLLVFVELAFRHCLSLPGLNLRKIYIGSF